MARFHSDYRPGTPPYAREYARLLKNRATLAALRASRAKSPEKKRRALKQASEARSKLKQVEARGFQPNAYMLFSAHQMGTCRMGRDPGAAVCDSRGAVFGVRGLYIADASAFPASSGVNPMITVMALAQCVGENISEGL